MMSSKDSLRQKYLDIQILYASFEAICFIIAILINGNEIPLLEICRLVIHQILFDKFIERISLFFQIYLFLFMTTTYIIVSVVNEKSHQLSYIILLYFPFSYKISVIIQRILNTYNLKNFELNFVDNEKTKVETLDYIVRSTIFKINRSENEQNHYEINNIAYIIKNNQILSQLYKKQIEQLIQEQKLKKESINPNIESLLDENDENLLGGYEIDTTSQKGREYIGKEQVFGENKQFKKVIQNMFNELFLKERNPKQFGIIDIYYLVFIVEVLQNYQFFELTMVQTQKNISLKHQQILFTIMRQVETLKETMRIISDEQQIFDSSFYEALIYDELILQTELTLEEAVQKKISLLLFMKQRHINLEDLQIQLEELLKLREELISQITLLIKVNEYSHRLYDAYLNYLETLSFSENDIKLDRFNRYQKGQRKIYFQMNSADACVLFASLKSEKDMKITKVSNNFQFMLGFEKQHLLNNSIEMIMPQPYTAIHKEYVLNFFTRGDTTSNLKQLLLFANTNSNHIVPINIDIKVNMINGEKDFGITAYIQKSQKQAQYILFESSTSRLVSMTSEINQFVFPFIKNFNRISLNPYFPFVQHFRHVFGNSSSILSKTSQLTLNSVRTRQLGTNQSFRSNEGTTRKGAELQKEHKKPKSIREQQILQKQINEVKDQQDHKLSRFQRDEEIPKNEQQNKKKQLKNSEGEKKGLEDMFSDSDDRRYRDVHFLLVVSNQNQVLMSIKSKQMLGLSDYKFYIMNINLYTTDSPGLENLKYMEITQVKSINPILNSKFIIQIYNDEIEGFMTNLHHFRTSDINCILSELEMKGIKDSNRIQNMQDQQLFDEDEEIQEFDLLHSKIENNQEVIYNRYANQPNNNNRSESKDFVNQLMGSKKYDTDEMDKSQRSGSLYKQKKSGNMGSSDNNFYNQKSINIDSNIYQFQQAAQYVKGKQQTESKEIKKQYQQSQEVADDNKNNQNDKVRATDQSTVQLLKQNSNDMSTSFIGASLKQHQFNQDNNISNYYDQSKQAEPNFENSNYQQPQELFEEKVFSPHPISLMSPAYLTSHDIRAGFAFANLSKQNESTAVIQESAKFYQNNDQSTNFPKVDIFSPKDLSSNQALKTKNLGFLSPANQSIQKMQSSLFSPDRNDQNPQSPINESQQMNDVIVKQIKSHQVKRQVSQSVKSLSKKRKQVLAAHKNEIKNLKDALDSSSNHSRESSASSTRKSTKSIILQKTTLGVMKIVNGIGIASFLVIIIVILQQYLQMNTSFNNFQGDMNFVNWASSYQISLSLVMKNYNFNKLLDTSTIDATSDVKKTLQTKAKSDLISAVVDIQLLLQRISQASTDRQIVKKMLGTNYQYKLGSLVNRDQSLVDQPSNYFFNTVNYDVSLYVGAHLLYASLFRYSRGLGTGTAQFIAVSNSEAIVGSLLEVSKQCQSYSIDQLSSIEVDVDSVLIIICLVTAFCIFTIIPVYSFIQTKREQIIQLFGTFNSAFIDTSIYEIQRIYSKNNSIKSINLQQMGNEQKRQNLSSTSRLNRTNNTVLVMAIVIFILTLPYPILNKTLSNRYISQNKDSLPMLCKNLKSKQFNLVFFN